MGALILKSLLNVQSQEYQNLAPLLNNIIAANHLVTPTASLVTDSDCIATREANIYLGFLQN